MVRAFEIGILVVALAAAAGSVASDARIELPEQTATLKPGPGSDLANGQCLICHSAEYITTQPSDKPLAFWRAEVEKRK